MAPPLRFELSATWLTAKPPRLGQLSGMVSVSPDCHASGRAFALTARRTGPLWFPAESNRVLKGFTLACHPFTPENHDRATRAMAGIEAATKGLIGPPPYQLAYTTYPHPVLRNPSPTTTNASSRADRSSFTVGAGGVEPPFRSYQNRVVNRWTTHRCVGSG